MKNRHTTNLIHHGMLAAAKSKPGSSTAGRKDSYFRFGLLGLLLISATVGFSQTPTVQTFTSSGTFTSPVGVTKVTVEAWGGGASGGGSTQNDKGGGGGGGGGYTAGVLTIADNTGIGYVVGAAQTTVGTGDGTDGNESYFSSSGTLQANGGHKGIAGSGTQAGGVGGAASGTGTVHVKGGDGGDGDPSGGGAQGGGGGSSAGVGGAGGAGGAGSAGGNGGTAPSGDAGGGGDGDSGDGDAGGTPGGGGAGGGDGGTDHNGGTGGRGQIRVTFLQLGAPSAPTTTAGSTIDASENAGFAVKVGSLNTTGAVVGDLLKLYQGGVVLQSHPIASGDLLSPFEYTFPGVILTGGDGAKSLTAAITLAAGTYAGNIGVQSSALNLTLDATSPAAFQTGSVITVGGNIVASKWNGTNTSVNVQVPVDLANTDASIVGGNIRIQARVGAGTFVDVGTLYTPITGPDRTTSVTLAVPASDITGLSGYGQGVVISFTAVVKDVVGNPTTGTQSTTTLTVDTSAPTVTVNQAAGQIDPFSGSPINFTAVFNEPINVSTFIDADVTISGTAGATTAVVTEIAPNNGTTFNIAISGMTSDGTVIAALGASVVRDVAGNNNTASTFTDQTVTRDTAAPTVTVNQASGQTDPSNASTINFTATFNEAINVSTFVDADVTISGTAGPTTAVVTEIAPMNGTTFNIAVSGMTSDGTVIAELAAAVVKDPAGNDNTASTFSDKTVTRETVPPTVTVNQAVAQLDPSNASAINFTATFSEGINVSTFTNGDVTISGTAGATTVLVTQIAPMDGTTFNIAVSGMTGNGTVIAELAAAVVKDPAGNDNAASTFADKTVDYDGTAPTVTVNQASGQVDPTGASPINFTAVFNEPIKVSTFVDADVTISGTAGATTAVVTEIAPMNGTTFNIAISGMTSDGTVIATLGAGVVTDPAGNGNTASTFTDQTVTRDTTPPTVTVNQAAGQIDPSNASTINFTAVFNEAINVSTFVDADVTIGGTAGATTAVVTQIAPMNGTTFNIAISGMTTDGTVIASLAASVVKDLAGLDNTASSSGDNTVTYDTAPPTVAVEQEVSQVDPTIATTINFTAIFNEPIDLVSFVPGDVTITGTAGATTAVISQIAPNDKTHFNLAITGMTGDGTVIVNIGAGVVKDEAGNNNIASTSSDNSVLYDVRPSVTVDQAGAQADPTAGATINFTVVFSKAINGLSFDASDVTNSGTAPSAVVGTPTTSDNITWNVPVTGMSATGTVILSLAAGVVTDPVGFGNLASSSTDNTVTYDLSPPSVTLDQAVAQADPTNVSPVHFTAAFSEKILASTFAASDLVATGTATGIVVGTPTSSDDITWDIPVTVTGSGTVILSLAASTVTDLVGNANLAASSTDNTITYDIIQPSVALNQAAAQADPTNVATINFTAVFSEKILNSSFTTADLVISGTATGGSFGTLSTSDDITWTIPVTVTGPGTVIVTLAAGNVVDLAGNTNTIGTFTDHTVTYDNVKPDVTLNQAAGQADPGNSTINFTAVFSEPINASSFIPSDVSRTGTSTGGTIGISLVNAFTFTVSVSGITGDGTVILTIPAGNVLDLAGNTSTVATFTDKTVTYDGTRPFVNTIVTASATNGYSSSKGTSAASVDYTVTFSEPVTGVDGSDFGFSATTVDLTSVSKLVTPVSTTVYTVTVSGYTGTGTLQLTFASDGTVLDLATNATNTSFTPAGITGTYSIVLPTPTNNVTSLTATPLNPYQIKLDWTHSGAGNLPTHYVLMAKTGVATYAATNDGTLVSAEEDFFNDNAAVIVPYGTTTYTWNTNNPVSMHSGTQYDFVVVPYALSPNNSSDNVDYLTAGNPTTSAFTTTGSNSVLQVGSTAPQPTISSLTDVNFAPGPLVFSFRLKEDGVGGAAQAVDDAPSVFTSLTFNDNGSSAIPWSDIIAVAQLKDVVSGEIVNCDPIVSNSITFVPTGTIGILADNQLKEYELRLYLKNPMTGSAKEIVDGKVFKFNVDNSSFAFAAHSSNLAIGQTQSSPGGNVVTVVATKFVFSTQPNAAQLVLSNVTATPVAPDLVSVPVVRAQDANGNTDLNYITPLTITNAGGIAMNNLPGGTMTPTAGVAAFPIAFSYNDAGNGTLTASGTLAPAVSNAVTVTYSALSTILPGALVEPTTISSLVTTGLGTAVFDFAIRDDGAAGVGDGSPTRITQIIITPEVVGNQINWAQAIGGANLTPAAGSPIAASSITAAGITFVINPATDGLIADGVSKTYTLSITLNPSIPIPLRNTIDNDKFVFEVLRTNVTLSTQSSTILAGEKEDSGGSNNAVDVVTTKLLFTTDLISPLLPNKDINLQLPLGAVPVVEAVDANSLRDTDYTSSTLSVISVNGLTMSSVPTAGQLANGLLTFATTFQYTTVGNGVLTVSSTTLPASGPAPSNASSINPVTVQAGSASTIASGSGPATISSLATNSLAPVVAFSFVVHDDPAGTAAAQDDGNATLITQIKIGQSGTNNAALSDWTQAIAGATISDGGTPLAGTVNATDITFASIPNAVGELGNIPDGKANPPGPLAPSSKTYTVKIYLRTALLGTLPTTIDGKAFGFQVTTADISTNAAGTGILPSQSQNSGTNTVTVVATKLDFTVLPFLTAPPYNSFPTSKSQFTDFSPLIGVEAHDVNNNLDLGFTGAIGTLTVNNSLTTANDPSGSFSGGRYTFPSNFHYTSGNNQDGALTLTAGAINGTSTPINIFTSSESRVAPDPTFSFQTLIPYVAYQAQNGGNINPIDIDNANGSFEIARILLSDGDNTTPDPDGASTIMTSLRVRIENALAPGTSTLGAIARMALYNSGFSGATEIAEKPITATELSQGYVDFTGLNIAAPDDNKVSGVYTPTVVSIRVSFNNNTPAGTIVDKTSLRVNIVGATAGGGSQFRTNVGDVAGYPGGLMAPGSFNILNAVATKLDFKIQPAPFAGINEPLTLNGGNAGVIEARDQFGVVDIDFGSLATLSAPVTINGSFGFTSGVLDLSSMTYGGVGVGTFLVSSNGLTSNATGSLGGFPNVSTQCSGVDVLHVSTAAATGGVISATNIAGGSTNKVIFGVTFSSNYGVAGSPNHPTLNKFVISFSNPVSNPLNTILNTPRVYQSATNIYTGGSVVDVTIAGATVTMGTQSITVDFNGSSAKPDLSDPLQPWSFFLMVNVDPNVGGTTPSLQPSVVDGGYPSGTNNNIVTTKGSSTSNTFGQTYTFASVFPPILTSSYPAKGQLNVDQNQSTINLTFSVPVWTLDGVIRLYDGVTNTLVYNCPAIDGQYSGGAGTVASPIKFSIPGPLAPNHVYYVTIAQGNLSALTGIMDQANNVFQGFTYPGTLFFKTASTLPPALLSSVTGGANPPPDPSITNISATGATINAAFDQQGIAYFLVVANNATAPTNSQIKGPALGGTAYAGFIARGSFQIAQTSPIAQFGLISPVAGLLANSTTYDVYMYAESNALPTPIAVSDPYGSALYNFAVTNPPTNTIVGPTLRFTTPSSSPTTVTLNTPSISVCNNSYQTLNSPIIINEGSVGNFNESGQRSLNIVLPAGFQFDVSQTAGVPTYGTLTLQGADFSTLPGSKSLGFLGTSILQIKYTNNSSTSLDKIIISGVRVIATTSSSGSMFRLGGNGLNTTPAATITDLTPMANLASFDAPTVNFDNSYSKSLNLAPGIIVTTIPDNADDQTATTAPLTIELIPPTAALAALGDFGPTSFTGQGVNVNILTLQAVSLDVPFNITVTHSDNNGCVSNNPVQYLVYDHNAAVNITNSVPLKDQGPYLAKNTGYAPSNYNASVRPVYATPTNVFDVKFDNLAGYYLYDLKADLPRPFPPAGQIIDASWQSFIQNNLLVQGPPINFPTIPFNPVPTQDYYSYKFDLATVIDGKFIAGLPDPYSYFVSQVTSQGNIYYNGGSLGFVELTGQFQSISNATVKVPRKQLVEFYVPAIPLVEVGAPSALQTNDASNLPYPSSGPASNKGTPIFCQAGGAIVINGYPAASVGSSVGVFSLRDVATNTVLSPAPGFVDNGNGTASIDPAVFTNNFKDIRIIYTYKANAAPAPPQSSFQIIRITPNPIAAFTWATPATAYVSGSAAQCAGQPIVFTSSTTVVNDATALPLINYSWNFGDVTGANNIQFGPTLSSATHKFDNASGIGSPYQVQLSATSFWGCLSVTPVSPGTPADLTKNVDVGDIPTVKFKAEGVSTADQFHFNSNDTPPTATAFPYLTLPVNAANPNNTIVSANDAIAQYKWDFGDGATLTVTGLTSGTDNISAFNGNVVNHNYTLAGHYVVNLTVTSSLGCVNSLAQQAIDKANNLPVLGTTYRDLVILPRVALVGGVYKEDFESTNANWQVWGTGKTAALIAAGALSSTWGWGAPTYGTLAKNVATPADGLISGAKVWKTGAVPAGLYTAGEKSALYSPSFDLTILTRPMISFNSVVQVERSDGVVLEYSLDNLNIADPNKVWKTLGVIADGQDWYRFQGIAGRPGTQLSNDYGWSDVDQKAWQTPKHVLDPMFTAATPPSKAVFRFALGSAAPVGGVTVQGFTLDNVRIGDRTRTILLENFVNASNGATGLFKGITAKVEKAEADSIKNFQQGLGIGTEVVKINYHVAFPGKDPFNEDSPADPSSRALFYNIVTTPRSRLDGEPDAQDRLWHNWGPPLYNVRTLQLAQADIGITVTTNTNGSISISGTIKGQVLTGVPAKTVLHIAVMEQSIPLSALAQPRQGMVASGESSFEYVLKRLLPTAAGTPLSALLPAGQTTLPNNVTVPFGPIIWTPDPAKLYQAPGDLKVAVFLQQEDAPFEVYQVELYTGTIADPAVVTAVEPLRADDVIVYPVPADQEMTIQLPGILAQPAMVQMIDQVGRVSASTIIPEGASSKKITTADLSAGVYILQIDVGNGNYTRKKVMIVH